MASKEVKRIVQSLKRQGFSVETTAKSYYLVFTPSGTFVARIPSTPSSPRTLRRIRARLRKHGWEG